jgi:hypothetical protein
MTAITEPPTDANALMPHAHGTRPAEESAKERIFREKGAG